MVDNNSPMAAFIALEPDEALTLLIQNFKHHTRSLVGDQLYLADPPHLTVYLAVFPTAKAVLDRWPRIVAESEGISVNLVGWHVFEADPMTGGQTLVCDIAANDKARLRKLQRETIELLAPLRDCAATRERLASRIGFLTAEQRRSVEQSGFPYLGDGWEPHFTIASIRAADWPTVWEALEPQAPHGSFRCARCRLYGLIDGKPIALDGLGSD